MVAKALLILPVRLSGTQALNENGRQLSAVDNQTSLRVSRRTALIAATLAVVLVLGVLYAYLFLPPYRGSRVSVVSGPVEFSLQLEKMFFMKGENVSVSISLRSTSNQTIMMNWDSFRSRFGDESLVSSIFPDQRYNVVLNFAVLDENNRTLFTFVGLRNETIISRTLAPNETATQTYLWNQKGYNFGSLMSVPAGTYHIKAFSEDMNVAGWDPFIQPETPSITIHIIEGQET